MQRISDSILLLFMSEIHYKSIFLPLKSHRKFIVRKQLTSTQKHESIYSLCHQLLLKIAWLKLHYFIYSFQVTKIIYKDNVQFFIVKWISISAQITKTINLLVPLFLELRSGKFLTRSVPYRYLIFPAFFEISFWLDACWEANAGNYGFIF